MAEPAAKELIMEAADGNTVHIPTDVKTDSKIFNNQEKDLQIVRGESEPIALVINTKQQDPSQPYDLISPLKALGYKIFREEEIQWEEGQLTNEELKSIVRAFLVYCTRKNPKSYAISIGTWGYKHVPTLDSNKEPIYPWRDIFSKFCIAICSPALDQKPKRFFLDLIEKTDFETCINDEKQLIIFGERRAELLKLVRVHAPLIAMLEQQRVISGMEAQVLQMTNRSIFEQADTLINILKTRPNAMQCFQDTLRETCQSGAATLIETEMDKYFLKMGEQFERLPPTSENIISAHPTAENFADDNSEAGQLRKEYLKEVDKYSPLKISFERPANDMRTTFEKESHVISNTEKHAALIINVRRFDVNSYRKGSEHDETYFRTVLKELGYTIFREDEILWENGYWSRDDILEIVTDFRTHCNRVRYQSIVIFIGSHGAHKNIVSSDERPICPWTSIFSKFYDANCPTLKGKPKLFFINACQVFQPEERDDIQIGGDVISDMLCCTSQVPGLPSYRDTDSGSWFVHCITYYIMRCAKDKDLLQILEMANNALRCRRGVIQCQESGTQPSQNATVWTHNLKKKIYFHIKPD